jgi:Flp pilus assembly protein TadB
VTQGANGQTKRTYVLQEARHRPTQTGRLEQSVDLFLEKGSVRRVLHLLIVLLVLILLAAVIAVASQPLIFVLVLGDLVSPPLDVIIEASHTGTLVGLDRPEEPERH